MISIVYSPFFIRKFNKLENGLQEDVIQKINLFKDRENHNMLDVHKLHGKFIGKNVTGIYVGTYDFSPIARYYSAEKTIVYLPNSVSNEMAVKGIKITQSDQRDSFFKINPKDNG